MPHIPPLLRVAISVLMGAPLAFASVPAPSTDACTELIPSSLRSAISRAHPGSRLVRESDYAAADIASELQYRHGNRCLGAASADVNGDRRNDFIFLIAAKNGDALVIAAISIGDGQWMLSTLETFSEDSTPRQYFVNTLPPDKYTDMYASDNASDEWRPDPGRLKRYTASSRGSLRLRQWGTSTLARAGCTCGCRIELILRFFLSSILRA
jgi:hypothetical protein